jgi:hypothetical protein
MQQPSHDYSELSRAITEYCIFIFMMREQHTEAQAVSHSLILYRLLLLATCFGFAENVITQLLS